MATVGVTFRGETQNILFGEDEADALSSSPIACAVADAWAAAYGGRVSVPGELQLALIALESATRGSPLRKVKP